MNSSRLHAVYAGVIVAVIVLGVILGNAYAGHVRDDATRDAVVNAQKSDISALKQKMSNESAAAQAQLAALDKQREIVIHDPAQAPAVIREIVPAAQSVPSPVGDGSARTHPAATAGGTELPDAPQPRPPSSSTTSTQSMCLSPQDQTDLAGFILQAKQCAITRDQLQSQVGDQQQVIDKQKTELDAATKAAKGGSVWQRTKRVLKWGAVFGAIGYVAGRAQR